MKDHIFFCFKLLLRWSLNSWIFFNNMHPRFSSEFIQSINIIEFLEKIFFIYRIYRNYSRSFQNPYKKNIKELIELVMNNVRSWEWPFFRILSFIPLKNMRNKHMKPEKIRVFLYLLPRKKAGIAFGKTPNGKELYRTHLSLLLVKRRIF